MAVFVPDASVTLAWYFEDETSEWSEAQLARLHSGDTAVVPQHWQLEVANTILLAVRRGRTNRDTSVVFFRSLLALPVRIDSTNREKTFRDVFAYAEKYKLTVYDAAYLELALREGVALATLDSDLRTAARAAGVLLA
jgi:predicted nucleic acid-binding protein